MTMNQDNQGSEHGDGQGSAGEEFVFAEEKRPINRNMVVLLLIACVGAGMIYLMYVRGGGPASQDDPSIQEKSEEIAKFMKEGTEDLRKLDERLKIMEGDVGKMTADNGAGQVPTEAVTKNPFQFASQQSLPSELPAPGAPLEDPKVLAAKVAAKVKIQMITYSSRGSSCIVNNKLCSEGDQIAVDQITFVVKRIAQDYVMLANNLGEFKISLQGGL